MTILGQVNEDSTAYLTVTFKDKDGVAGDPTSATYRIDDEESGDPVRASTAITLDGDGTVTITLDVTDNAIINSALPSEIKVVTIIGVISAGSDEVAAEFKYRVINLAYV